jgi:ABC-2 type transport system permease protein
VVEIWLRLARARVRSDWQYRASFSLILVAVFLFSFLDFVFVMVIFTNVRQLAGWSFLEAAFLYGTSGVAFNLANVFIAGIDRAAEHIRRGSFDTLLLRPLGTIMQLTSADIEPRRLARLAQSSVVLVLVLARVQIDWTPAKIAFLPVMLLSGMTIFGAIWIMTATIAFWTVDNRQFANTVTYGGNHLTMYPLDVVSGWLRGAALIVPLAFVNYLPAAWILDRPSAYDWPSWIGLLTPLVATALTLVSVAVWRFGIRHYRSTGS